MEHVEGEEVMGEMGELGEMVQGEVGKCELGEIVKGKVVEGEVVLPFELNIEESQDLLSLTEEIGHLLDPTVCTHVSVSWFSHWL